MVAWIYDEVPAKQNLQHVNWMSQLRLELLEY